MNMVIRSADAGNNIIPDSANRASGNTSVCSTPARTASCSAAVPGTAAACGANTLAPFSVVRSANSRKETAPKTSSSAHMK